MNRIFSKRGQIIIINILSVLTLSVVIFPLLLIAQYNYPSADDWSYGVNGYRALKSGQGVFHVIKAAVKSAYQSYFGWDGRFAAAFLDAFQPGIWGEKYYAIVTWLLLAMLIFSELVLGAFCVGYKAGKESRWLCLPIVLPALILQILYCPSPIESFYWYTGAINYTFVYGISLILIALFLKLGIQTYCVKWKYIAVAIISCILAVFAGGANFGTSLSSCLTLFILSVLFFIFQRKAFYRTWFVTLISGTSLALCIFAPGNVLGNADRMKDGGGAFEAIILSLVRSAINIYSWINSKVLLMILFILPFIWMAVRRKEFRFPFPALFTLITFGLYASQVTATMYVDGTTGGGRMAAILYYSYMIWLVGNVFYWVGWLSKKENKMRNFIERVGERFGKFVIVYCGVIGLCLATVIYLTDLREISSYRAYRDWRQGWAQQYAAEWDARLEVLHDDSVMEVEFAPLSVYPEMLLYTDLQAEDGYTWVNTACAQYYDKISIDIVE